MWDVVILGEGPAGISAALYLQRAGLQTAIIGTGVGSLAKAEKIDNYYGLAQNVSGKELHEIGIKQARHLGAQLFNDEILGLDFNGEIFNLTGLKENYQGKTVLIATGSARVAPKIEGLKAYEGHGVSYCAVCDGFFYKEKVVAVLGEGDYAIHEAKELAHIAKRVVILTNGATPKFEPEEVEGFEIDTRAIKKLEGNKTLEKVTFQDGETLELSGLFIALGTATGTDLARKVGVETDGRYVIVDETMRTNFPGVYAAGDCTGGKLQIYKAVAEGADAAANIIKYIRAQKK